MRRSTWGVYMALCQLANLGERAPTLRKIGIFSGYRGEGVAEGLRDLEARAWLVTQGRTGRANTYALLRGPWDDLAHEPRADRENDLDHEGEGQTPGVDNSALPTGQLSTPPGVAPPGTPPGSPPHIETKETGGEETARTTPVETRASPPAHKPAADFSDRRPQPRIPDGSRDPKRIHASGPRGGPRKALPRATVPLTGPERSSLLALPQGGAALLFLEEQAAARRPGDRLVLIAARRLLTRRQVDNARGLVQRILERLPMELALERTAKFGELEDRPPTDLAYWQATWARVRPTPPATPALVSSRAS